eukprot:1150117-Pelagomonas_calceolata.AAC.8
MPSCGYATQCMSFEVFGGKEMLISAGPIFISTLPGCCSLGLHRAMVAWCLSLLIVRSGSSTTCLAVPSVLRQCAQCTASKCVKHYKELLTPRTKVVCLVHVSNMLGAVLDTDYVVEEAHKVRHPCFGTMHEMNRQARLFAEHGSVCFVLCVA